MISHRYRCIYVKVPKCASTSVLEWFATHAAGRHSMAPWWHGGLMSERIQGVAKVMNLYPGYFTFTFVRNPYERFVSIYLYLERQARVRAAGTPGHPPGHGTLREFAELCAEVQRDFGPLWGREARDFFRTHAGREYGPRRIELRYLGFVTGHARRQVDFLPDCNPQRLFGVERVDDAPLAFVGTVENMAADFDRLRDALGLPAGALFERNRSQAYPAAGTEPWAEYYDDATRRLVEDLYAADLAFTGCGFGAGAPALPVAAHGIRRRAADRPPRLRTLPARLWFNLASAWVGVEARIGRLAPARRLLRPLVRLRAGRPR